MHHQSSWPHEQIFAGVELGAWRKVPALPPSPSFSVTHRVLGASKSLNNRWWMFSAKDVHGYMFVHNEASESEAGSSPTELEINIWFRHFCKNYTVVYLS
jgi:hypothetical protein